MAAAQTAENHADEWGLTWYLQRGIYAMIPTWTHSQNSLAAEAEALNLKISSHGIHISYGMKWHIPFREIGSQWKLKQCHDQNFPMEGKPL